MQCRVDSDRRRWRPFGQDSEKGFGVTMTSQSTHAPGVARLIVAASVLLTAVVWAQTPTPAETATSALKQKAWRAPRTPWGDPDLQGVWASDDVRSVPLQRPSEFGERRFLTDEEFAQRSARDEDARAKELKRDGGFHDDVGSRTFRQTSLVVDPADGRIPTLTPEAQRRGAVITAARRSAPASWLDRSLYDRCITRGVIGSVLPVPYGNDNQIFQIPGFVVIIYEMVHETRVIPLDGRPHVGRNVRLYMGDPRGHWEGETLVVDSTNFTDKTSVSANGGGTPHSGALHLVERFTRVDAATVQYDATIDDALTYSKPWTLSVPLTARPGYTYLPYECHEGNFALRNMLSAARAEETAVAEAIKRGVPPPPPTPWVDASLTTGVFGPPADSPRDPSVSPDDVQR
jgi:hypothetical protein